MLKRIVDENILFKNKKYNDNKIDLDKQSVLLEKRKDIILRYINDGHFEKYLLMLYKQQPDKIKDRIILPEKFDLVIEYDDKFNDIITINVFEFKEYCDKYTTNIKIEYYLNYGLYGFNGGYMYISLKDYL